MALVGPTTSQRQQIVEILNRRANEIAGFHDEYRKRPDHYGSVELALSREITRLRRLASTLEPMTAEEEEEE